MKDLLEFIVKSITGSDAVEVEEVETDGRTELTIYAEPEIIGIIIGKAGKTIKAIRNLLKVRAILEKKGVIINVSEKQVS